MEVAALKEIQEGRATQVYVQATYPRSALRNFTERIHTEVLARSSFWEPVVVGPICGEHDLVEALSSLKIRTTQMSYENYCADTREHRKFAERVGVAI